MTQDQKLLTDALEKSGYSDWYSALLHAALEETKDAAKAVEAADAMFAKHPADPSKPQENDADALFGGGANAEEPKLGKLGG